MVKAGIGSKTHAGVKSLFLLHYIKTGKVDLQLGKLYADLFDWRQKGDYDDFFDFAAEDVLPLFEPLRALLDAIFYQAEQDKA